MTSSNDTSHQSGEESAQLAEIVDRFEAAWQQGGRPVIDAFLPVDGRLRLPALRHLVHVDLERRFKAGESVRIEDYLQQFPELANDRRGVLALIAAEYALRRRHDPQMTAAEYLHRFPAYQADLSSHLQAFDSQISAYLPAGWPERSKGPAWLPGVGQPGALPAIPGYEILGELGRGGMGVVYQARQEGLNRLVALKMMLGNGHVGAEDLARFRSEAAAVARLQHPNIVQIYEIGEWRAGGMSPPTPYFSLEYMAGGSLARRLAGQPLPGAHQAAELVATLAEAIHMAHQRGIVHRDLKPANVLIQESGVRSQESATATGSHPPDSCLLTPVSCLKITDFGLAKRLDEDNGRTRTGQIMGTPSYMAPEQALGRIGDIGPATDIYALGAILYELVTGRAPFYGATMLDTLEMVRNQDPVPPTRLQPKVPRDLETICLKCLEKAPARRYSTAEALAQDLRRFLAGEPILARPVRTIERLRKWVRRRPAIAALLAVLVLASIVIPAILVYSNVMLQAAATREKDRADEAQSANTRYQDQLVETRRSFYVANLRQAQLAYNDLLPKRAAELLDDLLPPENQPDLRGFEWYYLRRLARQGQFTYKPDHQLMCSLAFSRDGRRLLTNGAASPVRLLDTDSGKEVAVFPAPYTHTVTVSADGQRVATAASNGSWRLWDTRLPDKPILTYHRKNMGLTSAVFSPDGKLVAGHDSTDGAIIWDAKTGRHVTTFRAPAPIRHLAFSPDSRLLAAGTGLFPADEAAGAEKINAVVLWDVPARKHLGVWLGHADIVQWLAFSGDGARLASASKDNTVKVWDVAQGKELLTYSGHSGPVELLIFSPDPRRPLLASVSGQVVKVWDAATGRDCFTLENALLPRGRVGSLRPIPLAFRPDGVHLAAGGPEGTIIIYESATGREVQTLRIPTPMDALGKRPAATTLAYSPDDRYLAAGFLNGWVFLWDRGTGRDGFAGRAPTGFTAYAFRPDGKQVAVGGGDGSVRLWDPEETREVMKLGMHQAALRRLVYSPDGTRVASCDSAMPPNRFDPDAAARPDLVVKVWDAATGKELFAFPAHKYWVERLEFSPDGRWLVSAAQRNYGVVGETKVWDLTTGGHAYTLPSQRQVPGKPDPVERGMDCGVTFSPDSRLLATAGFDGLVRLWEAASGQEVRTLRGHQGAVFAAAFSADGRLLATAGYDQTVKVWEVDTGSELFTLRGHLDHVLAVTFSPDGKRLVSGGQDRTLRIWDLVTRKELLTLRGHTQFVTSVRFNQHGRQLLSNGDFGEEGRRQEFFNANDRRLILPGTWPDPRVWDATPEANSR